MLGTGCFGGITLASHGWQALLLFGIGREDYPKTLPADTIHSVLYKQFVENGLLYQMTQLLEGADLKT